MAHREHAVGDDPREPRRSRDGIVLVERVLVSTGLGVGLHVLGGHDAGERGQVGADHDLTHRRHQVSARSISVDRAVHTTTPPGSTSSVSSTRKEFPPSARIDSILLLIVSVSPSRRGRRNSYS